jgi:hypothetical protein
LRPADLGDIGVSDRCNITSNSATDFFGYASRNETELAGRIFSRVLRL